MNRFRIFSCINFDEDDYDGPVVILACAVDPSFMLFFPITDEQAEVINHVLNSEDDSYDINSKVLGIYKTMIDSWKSSDRFLSGIIMDSIYDEESEDETLFIRLALSDHNGELDSLVHVNFLHAILLAAMEKSDIVVSDQFLDKMMPAEEKEERTIESKRKNFPEDNDIMNIANKIMSGQVRNEGKRSPSKRPKPPKPPKPQKKEEEKE